MTSSSVSRRSESGYTIIELLTVMLIISILLAIAIPTFLGQRQTAQDRDAQASLRNTLVSAKSVAAIHGGAYPSDETLRNRLDTDSGAVAFLAANAPSTGPKEISVHREDRSAIFLAVLSDSGSCWFAYDALAGGTRFGVVTAADFEATATISPADCYAGHENLTAEDFKDVGATPVDDGSSLRDVAPVDLTS